MLQEALTLHEKVLAVRQSQLGEQHADTAESHHNIGHIQVLMKKFKEAERHCAAALHTRRQLLGTQHPLTLATAELLNIARRR